MKNKRALIAVVSFLTMVLFTGANAQMCATHMRGCQMQGNAKVAPETLQKFNKEAKALQEQLIDKNALLQKEFLKDDPDPDAIANIKKSIIDIQRDIQKIAKKLGMKPCFGSCAAGACQEANGAGMHKGCEHNENHEHGENHEQGEHK
jgi:hypothetical protein